jgi:predicted RNase H-like nuclease (RuvC/YqgF family)
MENQALVTSVVAVINLVIGFIAGFVGVAIAIGEYKNRVKSLEDKIEKLDKEVKQNSTDLTEYKTKLEERTASYSSRLTKRKSPVSLTEIGEDLLKRSGSDKFVTDNKNELIEKIKYLKPQTAYDVQIDAKSVVEALRDEERFKTFKDYAFKEGIELEDIFIVMSIFLRDLALPELGFNPEDIDKHDPKKQKQE